MRQISYPKPTLKALLFIGLYRLVCVFVWVISLPFLFFAQTRTKYHLSIPARFFPFLVPFLRRFKGSIPECTQEFCKDFAPDIWIHACSFGEIKSLEPIICAISKPSKSKENVPIDTKAYQTSPTLSPKILITTTTQTGYDLACTTYAGAKHIRIHFLPFEFFLPLYRHRFRSLQMLIVTEAELWYELFWCAHSVRAYTLLINARISIRSYPRYKRFSSFYRLLFAHIDHILAQSQDDKTRLESLGAHNIEVFGNLKLLSAPVIGRTYPKPNKLLLVGASTHQGEEEIIVSAFLALRKQEPCMLVLAPRHPERFNAIWDMLESYPIQCARLSMIAAQNGFDTIDILLIDRLLELNNFYAISDIVILGGSFVPAGGHNPLEPAFFHTKLLSGIHIFNQQTLFACIDGYILLEANALEQTLLNHSALPNATIKDTESKLAQITNLITQTIQN